jgi:hypothetical protein
VLRQQHNTRHRLLRLQAPQTTQQVGAHESADHRELLLLLLLALEQQEGARKAQSSLAHTLYKMKAHRARLLGLTNGI